jgi:hypothetical protein
MAIGGMTRSSRWSKGMNAAEGSGDGEGERAGNSERIVPARRIGSGSGSGSWGRLGSRRIDRNRCRPLEIDNTRIASMVDHYKDSLDLQIHPKMNHSTSTFALPGTRNLSRQIRISI